MSCRQEVPIDYETCVQKVAEVKSILEDMKSEDDDVAERASQRAEEYLKTMDLSRGLGDEISDQAVRIRKKKLPPLEGSDVPRPMPMSEFKTLIAGGSEERLRKRMEQKKKSDHWKKEAGKALRDGNYDEALHCYSKALEETSDDYLLYAKRAETLMNMGIYHRALADCDEALRLDNGCLKAMIHKAEALYRLQRPLMAEEVLSEACHLHPEERKLIMGWRDSWEEQYGDSDHQSTDES